MPSLDRKRTVSFGDAPDEGRSLGSGSGSGSRSGSGSGAWCTEIAELDKERHPSAGALGLLVACLDERAEPCAEIRVARLTAAAMADVRARLIDLDKVGERQRLAHTLHNAVELL